MPSRNRSQTTAKKTVARESEARKREATSSQADARDQRLAASKEIPILRKLANAENEVTGEGFEIYEYRKPLGRIGRVSVPCDEAGDAEKVRTLLLRKNADILYGVPDAQALTKVISSRPTEFWLNAAHVGWRANPRAFVLQNRVIGAQDGALKVHPPLWLNERQRTVIGQEGPVSTSGRRRSPVRHSSPRA